MDSDLSLYADDSIVVTELDIDEDEAYRKHCVGVYEKINIAKRRFESEEQAAIAVAESRALRSSTTTVMSITSKTSTTSSEIDASFKTYQIDRVVNFLYQEKDLQVLLPKKIYSDVWTRILTAHLDAYVKRVQYMDELEGSNNHSESVNKRYEELTHFIEEFKVCKKLKIKTGSLEERIFMKTLTSLIYEEYVYEMVGDFSKYLSKTRATIDLLTNGIWISPTGEHAGDKELKEYLQSIATRDIPVIQRNYRMSSKAVSNLVKVLFAKDPEMRAIAKLDLASQMEDAHYDDILRDSKRVLQIACAEARLSHQEILAVVFPTVNKNTICLQCQMAVKITGTIYHKKCITIEWLIEYCRFVYDEQQGCLEAQPAAYFSPEKRSRISNILKLHAELYKPIVIRSSSGVLLYTRQKDGRYTKDVLLNRKPVDVVGTYEWQRKNGFIGTQRH